MSQVAEFDPIENPYRSSATLEQVPEASQSELRAFVGTRSDYYLRKWAPRLEDPSGDIGMNWAAFFLTAFWMAYRKMYAATFIFYGVVILLAIFEQVVFVGILGAAAVPAGVGLIVNIAVSLVCGLYGNAWYLAYTRRKIAAAQAQGLQDEHLMVDLARRGGTSLAAAFGIVLLGFVLLLVGIIASFIVAAAQGA